MVYLSRDKLAIFTITVYVNIIVYMYLYVHRYFPLYDALTECNEESYLSPDIG